MRVLHGPKEGGCIGVLLIFAGRSRGSLFEIGSQIPLHPNPNPGGEYGPRFQTSDRNQPVAAILQKGPGMTGSIFTHIGRRFRTEAP